MLIAPNEASAYRKGQRIKVLLFADNIAGYEVLNYLLERESVDPVGVIVHPEATASNVAEIREACDRNNIPAWDVFAAREDFQSLILPLQPDYIVSVYFDYILDDRFIQLPKIDAVNLHPGYLPFNKGFYYYAWAVIDGTPPGVSIHRIISEVDAGPIISQMRVHVGVADSGPAIYAKHIESSLELFKATWPSIEDQSYKLYPQMHGGTYRKKADSNRKVKIDPYQKYQLRELIDLVRAFSSASNGGCTIELDGKVYSIDIRLTESGEPSSMHSAEQENKKHELK